MDDHDRENVQFLLNASPDDLLAWWNKVSEDDREYASEILTAYRQELRVKEICYTDAVNDLTQSNDVLKKYRLEKKE